MSDINFLLKKRESIRLQIQALESKKNSGKGLTGNEQARLEDMYYHLSVVEEQLANYL